MAYKKYNDMFPLWKKRLLNVSGKNKLVNFKESTIANPGCIPVCKSVFFELMLNEDKSLVLSSISRTEVCTKPVHEEVDKKVLRFSKDCKSSLIETGSPCVYLCDYFLEVDKQWSPLLMLAIDLQATDNSGEYRITSLGQSIVPNYTLLEKHGIFQEFNSINVSEFCDDATVVEYCNSIAQKIIKKGAGKIVEIKKVPSIIKISAASMVLFNDFLKYNEINTKDTAYEFLIKDNKIEEDSTDTIDNLSSAIASDTLDIQTVVPMDASQYLAITNVFKQVDDKVHIIQGPPGTGKSQTIANIISTALHLNKSVLFVSDKKNAMDVIKLRLEQVKLSPYLLALHESKISKKSFQAILSSKEKVYPEIAFEQATASLEESLSNFRKYNDLVCIDLFEKSWNFLYNKKLAGISGTVLDYPRYTGPELSQEQLELLKNLVSNRDLIKLHNALLKVDLSKLVSMDYSLLNELQSNISKLHTTLEEHLNEDIFNESIKDFDNSPNSYLRLKNLRNEIINSHSGTIEQCLPILSDYMDADDVAKQGFIEQLDYLKQIDDRVQRENLRIYELTNVYSTSVVYELIDMAAVSDLFKMEYSICFLLDLVCSYINALDVIADNVAYQDVLEILDISDTVQILPIAAKIVYWCKKLPEDVLVVNFKLKDKNHRTKVLEYAKRFETLIEWQDKLEEIFNLENTAVSEERLMNSVSTLRLMNNGYVNQMTRYFKPKWWHSIKLHDELVYEKIPKALADKIAELLDVGSFYEQANSLIEDFSKETFLSQFEITDLPNLKKQAVWFEQMPVVIYEFDSLKGDQGLSNILNNRELLQSVDHNVFNQIHYFCTKTIISDQFIQTSLSELIGNKHHYSAIAEQLELVKDIQIEDPSVGQVIKAFELFEPVSYLLEEKRQPKYKKIVSKVDISADYSKIYAQFKLLLELMSSSEHYTKNDFARLICADLLIDYYDTLINVRAEFVAWNQIEEATWMDLFEITVALKMHRLVSESVIKSNITNWPVLTYWKNAFELSNEIRKTYGGSIQSFIESNPDVYDNLNKDFFNIIKLNNLIVSRWGIHLGYKLNKRINRPDYIKDLQSYLGTSGVRVRSLFQNKDTLAKLKALKPCFMMSPQTVAQYLDLDSKFDLVIIDEASQMNVEQAIPCLVRGKKVIVVGDEHQMEPQFKNNSEEYPEMESMLTFASHVAKESQKTMLTGHYRSKHPSLITFNNQAFYENKLNIIPSPHAVTSEYGTSVHFIENGLFEMSSNYKEAQTLVDMLVSSMEKYPNKSIGVIAATAAQEDLIEQLLNSMRVRNILVRDYIKQWKETSEPLFIKTVDNVQGDERDFIFISLAYGPNKDNVFNRQSLGSLSFYKKTNVMLSRAKQAMHVFCSFDPEFLNPTVKDNKFLRDFLDSHRGQKKYSQVDKSAELSSFQKYSRIVQNKPTYFNIGKKPLQINQASMHQGVAYWQQPDLNLEEVSVQYSLFIKNGWSESQSIPVVFTLKLLMEY